MRKSWLTDRTIDTFMRESNNQTLTIILSALLAGFSFAFSFFSPLIAVINGLISNTAPRLNLADNWLFVIMALASVILSIRGFIQTKTKKTAWGFLCVLCLISFALSIFTPMAGNWFLSQLAITK